MAERWRRMPDTTPSGPNRSNRGQLGRRIRHLAVGAATLCMLLLAACGASGGPRSASRPAAHATPTPTRVPTKTPVPGSTPAAPPDTEESGVPLPIRAEVEGELASMTLDEKIGQMLLIETYYQTYAPDVANMVENLHAGAMIIYGKNIATAIPQAGTPTPTPSPTPTSTPPPYDTAAVKQLHDYIAATQAHATIPLLITMDEEGGNVDRLGYYKVFPPLPSAEAIGATGDPQQAYHWGAQAASELNQVGINTDLAPVVDVREVPDAIEGPRLYASAPAAVDTYAGQFMKGLADNGIVTCLKHWPGIGSINLDPHFTLPTMNRSRSELESTEWAAFRGLLAQHPDMIMVTHVIVPEYDSKLPSSLSPALVQGVLRDELGYQGVVMTDSLYMDAISQHYTLGQAAVLSILAGDDLLEGAWNSQSMGWMIGAIRQAMDVGQITPARIDQSVRRILTLKALHGLLTPHA